MLPDGGMLELMGDVGLTPPDGVVLGLVGEVGLTPPVTTQEQAEEIRVGFAWH